jgi:hypothetical protein
MKIELWGWYAVKEYGNTEVNAVNVSIYGMYGKSADCMRETLAESHVTVRTTYFHFIYESLPR